MNGISFNPGWIYVALGILALCFGRRLFWAFVGLVGFVAGWQLATEFFASQPWWLMFILAVGLGLICAVLAELLQRVAAGVTGFLAGAYLASTLAIAAGWAGDAARIAEIAVGVICGIFLMLVFDWALIILSSLFGAAMVINHLELSTQLRSIFFVLLAVAGVIVQTLQLGGRPVVRRVEEQPAH